MTMNQTDWWTLALTTVIVAMALLLEHVFIGKRGWPQRVYYAMGLITDMGLFMAWGAIRGVTLDPVSAGAMMVAACVAGIPDFFLLRHEQQETERQWHALSDHSRKLAAELALFQVIGDKRRYSRAHNLIESLCFLRGGVRQDLEDMELIASQLRPLLVDILEPLQDTDNTEN